MMYIDTWKTCQNWPVNIFSQIWNKPNKAKKKKYICRVLSVWVNKCFDFYDLMLERQYTV